MATKLDHNFVTRIRKEGDFTTGFETLVNEVERLESQVEQQEKHITKLKELMLLTDPAVSNTEMNSLSMKQFDAYERWCQIQS